MYTRIKLCFDLMLMIKSVLLVIDNQMYLTNKLIGFSQRTVYCEHIVFLHMLIQISRSVTSWIKTSTSMVDSFISEFKWLPAPNTFLFSQDSFILKSQKVTLIFLPRAIFHVFADNRPEGTSRTRKMSFPNVSWHSGELLLMRFRNVYLEELVLKELFLRRSRRRWCTCIYQFAGTCQIITV